MSFAKPQQNLALPHAVQKRVDAMFAGTTGFSGPELVEYFSRLDPGVEQYVWSGGMPSRKQILQDCLARFPKERQLEILLGMLRPQNYVKYSPPSKEDCDYLKDWVSTQMGSKPNSLPNAPAMAQSAAHIKGWDVFISHASEDKESFARPLADALANRGLRVWFDAFTLSIGDSLRRSIDFGLAKSRFGVVVLSDAFFQKHWPQLELDGLVAREAAGSKVILPVWHNIDQNLVRQHSPLLADRIAVSSSKGLEYVVEQLLQVIHAAPGGTTA